jgi:hypothetical protein
MMMEAIRLSLVAEEDRKRKEEREARKDAKKRAKDEKKEAKQAEKLARKGGSSSQAGLYNVGSNNSTSTWATTSMVRSTSNLGALPEEQQHGKGKAPVQDFAGFNPHLEPTSTLNTELKESKEESSLQPPLGEAPTLSTEGSQRYLEESRANLQPTTSIPIPTPAPRISQHMRQISNASSVASSFADSLPGSLPAGSNLSSAAGSGIDLSSTPQDSNTPLAGTPSHEPMLNFRSLAAVIGNEDKASNGNEHIEDSASTDMTTRAEEELKEPSPTGSPAIEGNRSRGDSGESSGSAPPPIYIEAAGDGDQITPAPIVSHEVDKKDLGQVDVWDRAHVHEATQ